MSNISQIQIEQQYAKVGVNVTNAKLNITTQRPQMKIIQEDPEMTVESEAPKFELNWQKVRNESGLMDPVTLQISIRDKVKAEVKNITSQITRDGDFLGKVEQKGNRVKQLARSKSLNEDMKDINVGSMPQSIPDVQWTRGFMRINWTKHSIDLEWDSREYMPEMVVDPNYSVEIFLREKPYIKIIVADEVEPIHAGNVVDQKY